MQIDKEKILQAIQDEPTQEDIDYLVSLDEMATVGRSQQEKLLIQVNPRESQGAWYFKVYDSANEPSAKYIARIRFDIPLYEVHSQAYNNGKKNWFLNSKEKRKLITFLNANSVDLPQFTNWQYAILAFNKELGLDFPKTQTNLLSSGKLMYPSFLPFDLPMPNYMLLPPDEKRNTQTKQALESAATTRQKVQTPIKNKKKHK